MISDIANMGHSDIRANGGNATGLTLTVLEIASLLKLKIGNILTKMALDNSDCHWCQLRGDAPLPIFYVQFI